MKEKQKGFTPIPAHNMIMQMINDAGYDVSIVRKSDIKFDDGVCIIDKDSAHCTIKGSQEFILFAINRVYDEVALKH